MKLYLCLYWNKGDDFFFLLFFSQRMQIESVSVMQQENEIIFYRVASLFSKRYFILASSYRSV